MRKLLLYPVVLLLLTACASLGLETLQTPQDKYAAGIQTATTVNQLLAKKLREGSISPEDAEQTQAVNRAFVAGLNVGRGLLKTDPAAGVAKIDAIRAGLNATKVYLEGREAAKGGK